VALTAAYKGVLTTLQLGKQCCGSMTFDKILFVYFFYIFRTIPTFSHTSIRRGSMTFWWGSGSAEPCLTQMDPDSDANADPDPSIFIIDLQDAN
jgi:hypothetical protein